MPVARMMSGREQHGGHEELAVACRRPVLGRYSWGRMGWKSNIVSQNAVKKKDRAPVPAASSEVGVLFRPAAASVMARGPAARCGSGLRLLRGRMVESYGLTAGRAVSAAVGAIMTMIRCCPMASRARSFQARRPPSRMPPVLPLLQQLQCRDSGFVQSLVADVLEVFLMDLGLVQTNDLTVSLWRP